MISSLLIKNCGQLLTMRNGLGMIKNAFVICRGGRIEAVGQMKHLPRKKYTNVIDAKGNIVMPGLIDCHTHSIFAKTRVDEFEQRMNKISYLEILKRGGGILKTVRDTRAASEEELTKLAKKRMEKFLHNGITTVEIKTGYGLDFSNEQKMLRVMERLERETPIRIVKTFLGAHAVPHGYTAKTYLQFLIKEILPKLKNKVSFVDIFCEKGVFGIKESRRYLKTAKSMGFFLKIHGEQLHHTGACRLASELNAISVDHADHSTPEDWKDLKKSKTVVILLPISVLFLGLDRYANGRGMIDAGVKVALATNFNPGSAPSQNIFLAMNLACLKMGLTIEEAFQAVTINAATALRLQDRIGSLEVGKQADIVILKTSDYRGVVYSLGENLVEEVIVQGKIL